MRFPDIAPNSDTSVCTEIGELIMAENGAKGDIVTCQIRFFSLWHYLYVLTLPLFVLHLRGVWKRHERELDPMLPLLVVASFLFCLLGGVGFCVYLF